MPRAVHAAALASGKLTRDHPGGQPTFPEVIMSRLVLKRAFRWGAHVIEEDPIRYRRVRQMIAEARRNQAQRQKTYRAPALKMYPWICARCGREFRGKTLRALTVHYKAHNHGNNPPEGSATGSCCVSPVTTMSRRGIMWLTRMLR